MSSGKEHRRFPRYSNPEIPIRLLVPAFAADRLVPRDVSMEGFMVAEIPTRPGIGGLFDCAIEIENQVF